MKERDKMQKEFDILTKQPFFKRETDQNQFKRVSDLEKKYEDKDREARTVKANILKLDEEIRKLTEE